MSRHLLRLKLEIPAEVAAELETIAKAVNRGCNAAIRHWTRWHEDHPDWQPEPVRPSKGKWKGKVKLKQNGEPALESCAGPMSLMNNLYHVIRSQCRHVASAIAASAAAGLIKTKLLAKMPYDHKGEAKFKWQAFLIHEANSPSHRALAFPIHNRLITLTHGDAGLAAVIQLWSKESGRKETCVRLPIVSKGLPDGLRRIFYAAADRKNGMRHRDSLLVQKEVRGGVHWFLHLIYEKPDAAGLDKQRCATLWPAPPEWDHLFALELPDGTMRRVGQLIPFEAAYSRFVRRRKSIQFRFRDGLRKGRGRRKIFKHTAPLGRAMRDLEDRVRKLAVSDIMKILVREDVGSLTWHEPSRGLREVLAVAKRGLPWDWTSFAGQLGNRLEQYHAGKLTTGGKYRVTLAAHQLKFGWRFKEIALEDEDLVAL